MQLQLSIDFSERSVHLSEE